MKRKRSSQTCLHVAKNGVGRGAHFTAKELLVLSILSEFRIPLAHAKRVRHRVYSGPQSRRYIISWRCDQTIRVDPTDYFQQSHCQLQPGNNYSLATFRRQFRPNRPQDLHHTRNFSQTWITFKRPVSSKASCAVLSNIYV